MTRRVFLLRTVVALAVAGSVAAHVTVLERGLDAHGIILVLDHLFDIMTVILVVAVCTSAGGMLVSRLNLTDRTPLTRLLLSLGIGSGLVGTLLLGLGLAGLFTGPAIWILLAIVAAAAHRSTGTILDDNRSIWRDLVQDLTGDAPAKLGLVIAAVVVAFIVVMAVAPPTDWDTLMYHLQIPRAFLETGRIHVPADNLHAAQVGLAHMLYTPLLAAGSRSGPALLSAAFAIGVMMTAFAVARELKTQPVAHLVAGLVWGTPTIALVAITPRVDVTLTFFLLLAHTRLLAALDGRDVSQNFALAGVLLGFGFGIKYHAALYAIGLAPLALSVALDAARRQHAIRLIGLASIAGVVAAAPWLLKNQLLFGAPLFPFLASPRLEPWLAELIGSATVPQSIDPRVFETMTAVRANFNLRDAFIAPERVTVELEGAYYFANPALLVLPMWIWMRHNRLINWLLLPPLIYLAALLLPFPATNLRYLIPAVVPLTIVSVYLAVRGVQRIPSDTTRRLVFIVLSLTAMIPLSRAIVTWLGQTEAAAHALGARSAQEYLASHFDPSVRIYSPLISIANDSLPDDARTVMLFDARRFYLMGDVLADVRVLNWPILASSISADACLENSGITHVILATGSLTYYLQRGLDAEVIGEPRLREFAARCLEPIHSIPGFVVFRMIGTR